MRTSDLLCQTCHICWLRRTWPRREWCHTARHRRTQHTPRRSAILRRLRHHQARWIVSRRCHGCSPRTVDWRQRSFLLVNSLPLAACPTSSLLHTHNGVVWLASRQLRLHRPRSSPLSAAAEAGEDRQAKWRRYHQWQSALCASHNDSQLLANDITQLLLLQPCQCGRWTLRAKTYNMIDESSASRHAHTRQYVAVSHLSSSRAVMTYHDDDDNS